MDKIIMHMNILYQVNVLNNSHLKTAMHRSLSSARWSSNFCYNDWQSLKNYLHQMSKTTTKKQYSLVRRMSSRHISSPFDSNFHSSITLENINQKIRPWIFKKVDCEEFKKISKLEKVTTFNRLLMIHCYELFMFTRCQTANRCMFDCEIALPAICNLFDRATENEAKIFILGISQLDRLKTLSKLIQMSVEKVFFELIDCKDTVAGIEIYSDFIESPKKRATSVFLIGPPTLTPGIYPLLMGKTKGLQQIENDIDGKYIWPIFCYPLAELNSRDVFTNIIKLAKEPQYSTYGTIHIILNNEAEDCTCPQVENSCKLVKVFADFLNAPVIHVKADDVDSVIYVMNLASDYRAYHQKHIVIDLITSCSIYPNKNIALAGLIRELLKGEKFPLVKTYNKELINSKVIAKGLFEERKEMFLKKLQRLQYGWASQVTPLAAKKKFPINQEKKYKEPLTGASQTVIKKICDTISSNQRESPTPTTALLLEKRKKQLLANQLDWEICETLAYATLLQEGKNIHTSHYSKDTQPKLFFSNNEEGQELNPLSGHFPFSGECKVCESDVPPFATAGFEIGFSSVITNSMNIWEAPENFDPIQLRSIINQYFTFNLEETSLEHIGATFIIPNFFVVSDRSGDMYYSSQPDKILEICEECDIVTSMSDQLQSCNMIVANVSTPANLYHIIKRQARSLKQIPLFIFVPNKFRVCPFSFSKLEDLIGNTSFQPFIGDPDIQSCRDIEHVILCSGKVYFDLKEERSKRNIENKIALGRIEQIFPFPFNNVIQDLERFGKAKIWWTQEEECGDGLWNYIELRLLGILGEDAPIKFAGRLKRTNGKYVNTKLSGEELKYIFDMILDSS